VRPERDSQISFTEMSSIRESAFATGTNAHSIAINNKHVVLSFMVFSPKA
jgi:hypothetical protein